VFPSKPDQAQAGDAQQRQAVQVQVLFDFNQMEVAYEQAH
jgi:hypothetical protein